MTYEMTMSKIRTVLCALTMTVACHSSGGAGTSETLHTDEAGLGTFIDLPPGVDGARWVLRPLSPEGAGIGPTDYEVCATVSLNPAAWSALYSTDAPPPPSAEVRLPESIASSLFPTNVLATLSRDGQFRVVRGRPIDLQRRARSPYRGDIGVRFGDALVFSVETQ